MVEPGPVPQPAPKPDDQRAELERLRKMKRLQELEAKAKAPAAPQVSNPANGAGLGPVNPMVEMGLNAQREALLSQKQNYDQNMRTLVAANNAGVNIPGNPAELAAKAAAEPFAPRDPSIRLRPDPFGQTPFNKDEAIGALDAQERARQAKKDRREASAAYGAGSDFIQTTDEGGNVVPGSPSDTYVGKTIIGAPIQLGQGLAEGVANIWNNAVGMADDFVNTGNQMLLGDRAVKFDTPKIEVPANALVDQGGPLATELGVVPRIAGQFMAGRVPLGKAAPGGGVGAEIAKDALSFAATTDKETPRISDMIPSGTPGIGFMADMLRTQPGENTATAFAKNVIEDATISTAAIGFLKLAGKGLDVATGGGKATGSTPPPGTLTPVSGLSDAERKAIDLIIRKLDADGVTIEDVKRVAASLGRRGDSGVYETLAEIVSLSGKSSGANTRGLAMAGGAVPGPTQQALVARVNENTAKLPDRLSRAATRATGQDASNAVATLDELNARLKTEAGPLYEDFYNAPVDQRVYDAEIAPVLNAPHGQAAMERAARGLGVEAASLQARVASTGGGSPEAQAALQRTYESAMALKNALDGRGGTLPPLALDHVKRAFDDLIDEAGQGTYTGGNLRAAKRNFAESVSNATGGAYGNALGTYEGIKRLEDAFETGLKALTQKTWQLERDLAKGRGGAPYSGGEIEALAMGVARHIEDLIEANDQAALTKLLKGKALQNMAMALGNEKAAKMFEQSIRRLAGNREFGRRVAGGSDTAMRQAAIRDAGVEAEDAVTKSLDAVERGNVPLNLQSVVDASLRGGARKAKEIYRQFRYPGLYDEDVNAALAPLISQPMTETRVNDLASKIAARNAQRGRVRGGVGNALLPGQAKARLAAPTTAPSPPRRKAPPKPNDAGFAGVTPLSTLAGASGGAMAGAAMDKENPGRGAVLGALGAGAVGYGAGRKLSKPRPAGNALKSGPAKAPPAMAEAPKAPPAGPSASVSEMPGQMRLASARLKDGSTQDVVADVFTDRGVVVVSPSWPTNAGNDLADALVGRSNELRGPRKGLKVVDENYAPNAPREPSPKWSSQNPQEMADLTKQVADRFIGLSRNGDAHVLALTDEVDLNSLASYLEANIPSSKQLVAKVSPEGNGDIAIVSKRFLRDNENLFPEKSWKRLYPSFNQERDLLDAPADWAAQKAPPASPPVKPSGAPKPPPVQATGNKLNAPPSGKSRIPGEIGRRLATGAATWTALTAANAADAQEDLSPKIGFAEQQISSLRQKLADFDNIKDPRAKQRFLKDAGYYAGIIDGNIAGKTTEGMERWTAKIEADMAKYEADLVDLRRRDALQRNEPNPYVTALRDVGPNVAAIAVILGMKPFRASAAKKSVATAEKIAKGFDRYVTKGPVTSYVNKADQSRPANLNTFWKAGGAKADELPFLQDSKGGWKPNPNAKPADELFSDNGYWKAITRYVSGKDLAFILGGTVDAVGAQFMIDALNEKLRRAEALWNDNPSDETARLVEDARNEVAMYTLVQRLGAGVAAGRVLGSFGNAYARPRPKLEAAATEQAAIKNYIAGKKPPPRPRAPKVLPPTQLPPGGGTPNGGNP